MSKYLSITVKNAMRNIATNQYLLPAIQRKFVWEIDQIEMLFDSILRNYPINSFMLWKITDSRIKSNYKFYVFLKDYAKKFHEDNPDAPAKLLSNDFYAVIDGQQRMTSLYIGLIGSYRSKRPNKRWKDNENASLNKIASSRIRPSKNPTPQSIKIAISTARPERRWPCHSTNGSA